MNKLEHRVDRVLGFFSSRPNWDPHTRRRVCPPPVLWLAEGRDKLACGDKHCGTPGIFVLFELEGPLS